MCQTVSLNLTIISTQNQFALRTYDKYGGEGIWNTSIEGFLRNGIMNHWQLLGGTLRLVYNIAQIQCSEHCCYDFKLQNKHNCQLWAPNICPRVMVDSPPLSRSWYLSSTTATTPRVSKFIQCWFENEGVVLTTNPTLLMLWIFAQLWRKNAHWQERPPTQMNTKYIFPHQLRLHIATNIVCY